MVPEMTDFPVLDRVLVHLLLHDMGDVPSDPVQLTQAGIASGVGVERKHVPRAVRTLAERNCLVIELSHVNGARQRKRLHRLSEQGRRCARDCLNRVGHGLDVHSLLASPLRTSANVNHPVDRMIESAAEDGVIDAEERRRLLLVASLLNILPDELDSRIRATGALVEEPIALDLTGEGALWLACLETALVDGTVSPDEQALLASLGASLKLTDAHVDAWLVSLLHDMMK